MQTLIYINHITKIILLGMALIYDPDRKCAVQSGEDTKQTSCQELAANAFSTALQYDSTNEAANHMLATVTADAR